MLPCADGPRTTATQVLLDDFNCALRKKVLLQVWHARKKGSAPFAGFPLIITRDCPLGRCAQGRLYVFDHYVCFSSSLFGQLSKKVVIPLEVGATGER